LEILSINLNHRFDSKGFYRPVYVFEGLFDGELREILIAAEG